MKIWMIGRHYPTINNKMRGSFELEQARLLAKAGHDVIYIAVVFHPKNKIRNWGFASWTENELTICGYSCPFFPERMNNIKLEWFRAIVFKKAIRMIEGLTGVPDIIHVHYPTMISDPSSILMYKEKGSRIICTEHWSKVQEKKLSKHELTNLTKYVNDADCFITVGEPLRRSIIELTNNKTKVVVIPDVVEDIFRPEIKKGKKDIYEFIVVSRLVKGKQIDKIIHAFNRVKTIRKDICLTVIGDGPERGKLESLIDEFGYKDSISLLGTLTREEVSIRMARADCLICYSDLETFGVPIIEAWASGIPVISSDRVGLTEYWNEKLGYIVSASDTDELAKRMSQIIVKNYDQEYLSSYAKSQFGEQVVLKMLEKIYLKET